MFMETLNQTFTALSDPTRRGILAHLAQGEATVSELVAQFDLTQPTISSHLKILEAAGLISRSRKAQMRPCKLEAEGLKAIDRWLERFRAICEGNFERLDMLLEELKSESASTRKTR